MELDVISSHIFAILRKKKLFIAFPHRMAQQQALRFRGPAPPPNAVMRGPPPLMRPPPPFGMMRGPPPPPRPPFARPPFDPNMPPMPPPGGIPPPMGPPHLQVSGLLFLCWYQYHI